MKFSKFNNLELEKQERIINTAMKEFAQKGFDKASTNEIVKEANIGKGMLFHYFNSKKDLYLFLYDYILELLGREFFGRIDLNETDILKRWRQIALLKIDILGKHPEMFKFMMTTNLESANEVISELKNRNQSFISNSYGKIYENIDTAKFREGIDIKRALDIISWTMEGFAAREQEKAKQFSGKGLNYNEIIAEMDIYIEFLRSCLYQ